MIIKIILITFDKVRKIDKKNLKTNLLRIKNKTAQLLLLIKLTRLNVRVIKRNLQTFNLVQSSSMRIGRIFSRNSSCPRITKEKSSSTKETTADYWRREREGEMVVKKERGDPK